MLHNIGAHQLMTHDFIKLAEDFVTAKTWREGVLGELLKKDNLTDEEIEQIITPVGAPGSSTPEGIPMNEQNLIGVSAMTPEEGELSGQSILG